MVPFALAGLAIWAVAGLIALAVRPWLDEHDHESWLWICLAGFLLGLPGLATMVRHDARRRPHRERSDRNGPAPR
ncbi:MAG: DUF2530 domain-containing protein [Micromonosporaceae bacterium]|nr:DUF2530 domain-containing protein [Micromonosporaceae bacterium]